MQILQPGLDKKQLKKYIVEQLNAGILKTEMETNLNGAGYVISDYKKIISRYPELEMKKKYKSLIIILIILEVLLGFGTFAGLLQHSYENNISIGPIIALLGFVFPGIIIFYIAKNNRIGYKIALIFGYLYLLNSTSSIIGLIVAILYFIFIIFLGTKLFQDKDFWKMG